MILSLNISGYFKISVFFILILVVFMTFNPGMHATYSNTPTENITKMPDNEPHAAPQKTTRYAIVTGSAEKSASPLSEHIFFTFSIIKYPYVVYDTILSFSEKRNPEIDTLVIATPDISQDDIAALKEFLAEGCSVVFAVMPEQKNASSPQFQELLGIQKLEPGYEIEGFGIYEDLLIGGVFETKELSFNCFKVSLSGTCKVYATGNNPLRDKSVAIIDREDENPLIWRTYYEGGAIYVINAPFMEEQSGAGILTGILAMTDEDFIYPIIGAKAVILDSFPYIAGGDKHLNNRTVYAFLRDVVWPDLISIARESDISYTCYTNGNFAQNVEATEIINFFTEHIYKSTKGEMGYLVNPDPAVFDGDMRFLNDLFAPFGLQSYMAYSEALDDYQTGVLVPNMTSIILPGQQAHPFSWVSDQAVTLPIISEGVTNEKETLKFTSMMSAMGLVIHRVDMEAIAEGSGAENEWNIYALEFSKYFSKIFKETKFIPAMTISETAEVVKDYLNSDCFITADEGGISVDMYSNSKEMSFILKTEKTITGSANCTVDKIEDGVYIIRSVGPGFHIALEDTTAVQGGYKGR